MIPFFIKKNKNEEFNFLDINRYNDSVNNMNSYSIQCNCGCKGSCIKYGKYKRIIDKYEIFIQRVLCKVCRITHAILPTFIVPYERMPLDYILDVVLNYEYINTADYELKRYKRIYTEWEMRLKIIGMTICDDINKVITFCAYYFNMCFMQSKIRKNSKLNEVKYFIGSLPT